MAMLDLNGKTDNERFEFLKNISKTLNKHSEVWITIKASEISYYKYLLESTNTLCIMLPDKEEAIVKGYEVVKKIHTLNLTSSISLLEFSSKSFCNQPYKSLKIKNVAKQFLGIDLYLAGVVLSNNKYFSMINEGNQVGMKSIINKENNDFICTFCENIVNLRLGTY